MNLQKLKRYVSFLYKIKYRVKSKGWIYIGKGSKIKNTKSISFGNGTQVMSYSLLCPLYNGKIILGDNSQIGMFSRITCNNLVEIGKNVITGPNVFISDYNHKYEDVNTPICFQGNTEPLNKVCIGDDCWIGTNVIICGNVKIGKHVVIGGAAL